MASREDILATLRTEARPLSGLEDVQAILDLIGEARLVLLGEATHGTHEFYRLRANLSRRLITDKGFDAIAVEADWPDALRVSRYIQGASDDHDAIAALGSFERFPRWMWRNTDVVDLVEWLRSHNQSAAGTEKAGFFGLDLYSLRASMAAVIGYLARVDPEAARRARQRYACFDAFGDNPQYYGYAITFGLTPDCEAAVLTQLMELLRAPERHFHTDGIASGDELFYAQQNARVVSHAEAYYRVMFQGRDESWNLRDTHMADTLDELQDHLAQRLGRPARIVVWAHNSHIGDARATSRYERGEINLGQLVRERHRRPGETFNLGFTTHDGTVAAASDWDEPVERKTVRPSREDSVERLLHDCGLPLFALPLAGQERVSSALAGARLERAIGVIYRPDTELASHYFLATLPCQFDAVVHVDHSRAVRPIDAPYDWEPSGEPETFPSGV